MSASKSCALPAVADEKPRYRKPHFFSSGLSGVHFSWSFVMRSTLLSANRSSASSSSSLNSSTESWSSVESCNSRSVSGSSISGVSSDAGSSNSSNCSSSKRSLWSFGLRRAKRRGKSSEITHCIPQLDNLPFSNSGKYLTVIVGARAEHTAKYVISRSLLAHPLFQVMLTVSKDEYGKEYAADGGVSIVCDPDLFLEVVRVVDGNLQSVRQVDSEE
ncbi:SAUR family protein [Marchantia polymorpha subsp. ruderalis]|uniref:Uncharacterized protein n=2 Tax=Marchantia polymorpha TaxID=3197 RepID=A0AAF6AV29_MARPO|nr:hypothetical protein MARPO_0002s0080 [Marchantia polymorpha]BBN00300.1 hypothetical protein Mp_1g27980 [Marchantia polymorpha subsp. ruderalis]|eukprot:PTQ49583.1 hypothetical protein MARPO_0002s0080 [Marchantia polymorpha]